MNPTTSQFVTPKGTPYTHERPQAPLIASGTLPEIFSALLTPSVLHMYQACEQIDAVVKSEQLQQAFKTWETILSIMGTGNPAAAPQLLESILKLEKMPNITPEGTSQNICDFVQMMNLRPGYDRPPADTSYPPQPSSIESVFNSVLTTAKHLETPPSNPPRVHRPSLECMCEHFIATQRIPQSLKQAFERRAMTPSIDTIKAEYARPTDEV